MVQYLVTDQDLQEKKIISKIPDTYTCMSMHTKLSIKNYWVKSSTEPFQITLHLALNSVGDENHILIGKALFMCYINYTEVHHSQ